MVRIFMASLAAAMLFLWAPVVHAKTSRAQARKARRLYKRGQKLYKRGAFLRAAESFESGYALDPRPAFLINAAQAYRQAKRPKAALARYRKFIEIAPSSRLRKQVEGLIHDLEDELGETSKASPGGAALGVKKPESSDKPVDEPLPPFVRPDTPTKAEPKVAASSPFYKKWWFWTAVGVVVVGTATGVGVAAASSGGDDYVKEGGLGVVRW